MSADVQKLILGGSAILLGIAGFLAGGGEVKDLDPVGLSPAEDHGCPAVELAHIPDRAGWQDTSSDDEHGTVLSCEKDGWLAVLTPEKRLSHGFLKDTPGAVFLCPETNTQMLNAGLCVKGAIPGWPATSLPSP